MHFGGWLKVRESSTVERARGNSNLYSIRNDGPVRREEYFVVEKLPHSGTDNEERDLGNYVNGIAGVGPGYIRSRVAGQGL